MFRSIDIDVANVIFSKILARDAGGKPHIHFAACRAGMRLSP
jgi:hypothetical protein